MKAIKITLALALLLAMITSCTKQDLNEEEVLETSKKGLYIGGYGQD